jgi:hypothetical protein
VEATGFLWLIVNGIQRVRDGMKVQPEQVPMPSDRPAAESAREQPTTKGWSDRTLFARFFVDRPGFLLPTAFTEGPK